MGMKFSELFVTLGFRDDRFRKGIKGAQKQTSLMAKSMKSLGMMIAGTFAVQGILQFGRALFRMNVEFEKTMSSVKAITNATDKEFKEMKKSYDEKIMNIKHGKNAMKKELTEKIDKLEKITNDRIDKTQAR